MMKIKQRGSSRAGLEEKGCFVSDPPRRGFFLEDRGERCGRKVEDRKERRGEEEEKKRGWKEEETMNKSLEAREEEPPSLLATSFTKTRPPHRVPLPPSSPTAPRSRNEKEREKMFPPSHKRSSLSSLSPRARAVPPHLPFLLRRRTGEGVRKEHPRGRKERVDIRVGREKEGKGERERGEMERKREKKRRKRAEREGFPAYATQPQMQDTRRSVWGSESWESGSFFREEREREGREMVVVRLQPSLDLSSLPFPFFKVGPLTSSSPLVTTSHSFLRTNMKTFFQPFPSSLSLSAAWKERERWAEWKFERGRLERG